MVMPLAWPIRSRLARADANCRCLLAAMSAIAAWVASIAPRASTSWSNSRGLRPSKFQGAGPVLVCVELKRQDAVHTGRDRGGGELRPP